MVEVTYRIVEHDGGWAYKLGDVFSETFRTRTEAEAMAERVAAEQRVPGETEAIEWEDEAGEWHEETASGSDRPEARVEQSPMLPAPRLAPTSQPASPLLLTLLVAGLAGVLLATVIGRRGPGRRG